MRGGEAIARCLGEREVLLAAGLHYLKSVQQSSRGRPLAEAGALHPWVAFGQLRRG
jgi:hypothetical protein